MPNALIHETSPYLLQHAHNPVDWQPWSEQAFARARSENKLVFLSIGYSTCHWCHVMEHESFENPQVAEVINRHFISVKVDREERPDIDATYMAYVQATTGQGGWPMSVWLTPAGAPVFGGTYFPPDNRHGRPGFTRVCEQLGHLWRNERTQLETNASSMMEHLRLEASKPVATPGLPDRKAHADFINYCESVFDDEWGGWGGAPKFPRPVVVRALMQLSDRFGRDSDEGHMAWNMSATTLRAMAAGGLHDQLGGGFHRYSVDRYWHVPHYEKMLYDQAQLAMAYLDAWQISGEALFRDVSEGIFRYLVEILRDPGGAYHAAEDADSLPTPQADHKREGAFWTWAAAEIEALLAPRDAAIFSAAFGLQADGNARPASDPHGELIGQNTLFRAMSDDALAELFDCTQSAVRECLAAAMGKLAAVRAQRPPPHRDDKIITAWNGLTLGAMARGARVLERADLAAAATRAAEFIKRELWDGSCLFRSWRGQRGNTPAFPADYVALICGLIELEAVSPAAGWLDWALQLQDKLDTDFWDETSAGYVMRPALSGNTLRVIREDYDGAEPSPNHLAAENLLKLAILSDAPEHAARAEILLRAGCHALETQAITAPLLLAALDLHERGVMKFQIPIAAPSLTVKQLHAAYFPRAVFTHGEGKAITVCEGVTCRSFLPGA
ncbi:MAG: thioredoxin domain-containing protein [Verrucomicrobia bacterium]|nr:MAG: thioredoxin domain-containing protein [Verrucomicrobiota bacterium]